MIQAEATAGAKVSVSLGVFGTESRPMWLERMGEGRQGQRRAGGRSLNLADNEEYLVVNPRSRLGREKPPAVQS